MYMLGIEYIICSMASSLASQTLFLENEVIIKQIIIGCGYNNLLNNNFVFKEQRVWLARLHGFLLCISPSLLDSSPWLRLRLLSRGSGLILLIHTSKPCYIYYIYIYIYSYIYVCVCIYIII